MNASDDATRCVHDETLKAHGTPAAIVAALGGVREQLQAQHKRRVLRSLGWLPVSGVAILAARLLAPLLGGTFGLLLFFLCVFVGPLLALGAVGWTYKSPLHDVDRLGFLQQILASLPDGEVTLWADLRWITRDENIIERLEHGHRYSFRWLALSFERDGNSMQWSRNSHFGDEVWVDHYGVVKAQNVRRSGGFTDVLELSGDTRSDEQLAQAVAPLNDDNVAVSVRRDGDSLRLQLDGHRHEFDPGLGAGGVPEAREHAHTLLALAGVTATPAPDQAMVAL